MAAGADAFRRRLERIPKGARKKANEALRAQAIRLGTTIKSVVPVDKAVLKNSVRFQLQELRAFVKAGGPATTRPVRNGATAVFDYSLGVEFGTKEQPAQPFFWPSYRLLRKEMRSAINRSIKKGIEDAYGK